MQILNSYFLQIGFFLIVGVFLGVLFLKFVSKQKALHQKFPGLLYSKYFFVKYILLLGSFLLLFFSLLWENISETYTGKDIVFVLDVSQSMNVIDGKNPATTRLESAKNMIGAFVSSIEKQRFGLVIFSGEAVSVLPLTQDRTTFLQLLQKVDSHSISQQGSDILGAIKTAQKRFFEAKQRQKIIILISDGGEEKLDISQLKKENIQYFVVGIGSLIGGKIITGTDNFGNTNYKKYKGEYVVSKINEENLQNISHQVGGVYLKKENDESLKKFLEVPEEEKDTSRVLLFFSCLFFVGFLCLYWAEKNLVLRGKDP